MTHRRNMLAALVFTALCVGCSDDNGKTDSRVDQGPTEGGPDQHIPAGPGLMGVVKDAKGVPVEGAKLEVSGKRAYSDAQGKYTLEPLTPGAVTVHVAQDWFQDKSVSATVKDAGMTTLDIAIDEHPLKLEPADKTLADGYNATFDWTKDTISIVILPAPTRRDLDNAVYFRNPALFRDTSGETAITPSPQPTIGGSAQNFTFPTAGTKEALDNTSIVDTLDATPLTADEKAAWMMYKPMFNWLTDWDATKITALNDAAVAVRQQTWGASGAVRPQDIEQVFIHGKEIWVQVVFEDFVKLGSGITDSDGDGREEVYARLAAEHYTDEIVTKLSSDYVTQPSLDTHGMSKELNLSLNDLYTTTAAEVDRYIAQPFDVSGVGQISYPFVVLKHSGGKQNVLLVGP